MKENLPDPHTIPFNVTKELVDEVDAIMQKRGYQLILVSHEEKERLYVSEYGISANVRMHSKMHITMTLYYSYKLFFVSTSQFDFYHKQLRKWFESPLLKIKRKIEEIEL